MQTNPGFRHTERGATLIVALVFLLILTAAGITAVRLSTNSERMASNSQFRGTSFQLAQSELKAQFLRFNSSLANRAPLQGAMEKPGEPQARFPERKVAVALTAQINTAGLTQTTSVNSMRNVDCLLFGKGDSAENFNCNEFTVTARSTLTGGAYSEQVSGLILATPK